MSKGTINCIYCGAGRSASKEHILPQAIGGSYSSSDIICDECNSYFGRKVDLHITDWQPSLVARNWFDLEGYGGSVRRYEVEANDGAMLTVGRNGDLRPKWRNVVTERRGKEFAFSAGAPSEAEAHQAIQKVIAKQIALAGHSHRITEKRVETRVRREWKPFESDVVYDYRKQGRAIAKMALHYLATQLDRRFLSTRDFEPIMQFVRNGRHGNQPRLCQPAIFLENEPEPKPCIEHSLALRCSHELRSAICDVTLFGVLTYSVVLSYSYEGPDLFRTLHEYPLQKRNEEGPAPQLAPVPASLILNIHKDERQRRYDHLEKNLHNHVDWVNEYGFCKYIRSTLPSVMEHVNSKYPSQDHGSDKWMAAVADEFSDKSSPAALVRFLGEPSQVAAKILFTELKQVGAAADLSLADVEEAFAKLIFIRLLVDAVALLVQRIGAELSRM
jgi:hypothetical protein